MSESEKPRLRKGSFDDLNANPLGEEAEAILAKARETYVEEVEAEVMASVAATRRPLAALRPTIEAWLEDVVRYRSDMFARGTVVDVVPAPEALHSAERAALGSVVAGVPITKARSCTLPRLDGEPMMQRITQAITVLEGEIRRAANVALGRDCHPCEPWSDAERARIRLVTRLTDLAQLPAQDQIGERCTLQDPVSGVAFELVEYPAARRVSVSFSWGLVVAP